MAPSIHVVYHEDCPDGFGAAYAAWTALGHRTPNGNPVIYHPADYGDPPPETDPNGWLYILDFSYALDTMLQLHEHHQDRLLLLDHHRTAMERLQGQVPGCRFNMNKSGAVMAWEYFHPQEPLPELLAYVQDRDLWRWELPHSREINAALDAKPKDFKAWAGLGLESLRQEGALLLEPIRAIIHENLKNVEFRTFSGHRIPMLEVADELKGLVSETGEALLELHDEAPFAALHHIKEDGSTKWSLRARPGETDVSEIARRMGGGGHQGAAGFTTGPGQEEWSSQD